MEKLVLVKGRSRMATKWLNRALIGAGLWLTCTTGAWALTLQVVGQGLWATNQNYGCLTGSANCLTSKDFTLTAPALATGTIVINAGGTLATMSLQMASATFLGPSLSTITFAGVNYAGTAAITTFPGGTYFQTGLGSGSASGTANLNPFSVLPSITNLNCTVVLGAGQCGLTYGFTGGFANVQAHDWVHTFNVNVVALPEPASALLVALGVAGLLLRSRRA